MDLLKRPRRNRKSPAIRSLVGETHLMPSDLVAPFIVAEKDAPGLIPRTSLETLLKEAEKLHAKGIPGVALFPALLPEEKTPHGEAALDEQGLIPQAIRALKREIPSLCIMADVALDPFTTHGHDGLLCPQNTVLNDETVEILCQVALLHAACGVDFVAPSDMMDGRVGAIRRALDAHGHTSTGIISYTAKYASSLYAPYRSALGSTLQHGDKKGYQMNPGNVREALLEARLDEEEGADVLMVKPALFYLDIIAALRARTTLPLCGFHVSGEYAMVMAAHNQGLLNAKEVLTEALLCIKRAGADFIISYAVPLLFCGS